MRRFIHLPPPVVELFPRPLLPCAPSWPQDEAVPRDRAGDDANEEDDEPPRGSGRSGAGPPGLGLSGRGAWRRRRKRVCEEGPPRVVGGRGKLARRGGRRRRRGSGALSANEQAVDRLGPGQNRHPSPVLRRLVALLLAVVVRARRVHFGARFAFHEGTLLVLPNAPKRPPARSRMREAVLEESPVQPAVSHVSLEGESAGRLSRSTAGQPPAEEPRSGGNERQHIKVSDPGQRCRLTAARMIHGHESLER